MYYEFAVGLNNINMYVFVPVECNACGSAVNSRDTNDFMCVNMPESCSEKTGNVNSSTQSVSVSVTTSYCLLAV